MSVRTGWKEKENGIYRHESGGEVRLFHKYKFRSVYIPVVNGKELKARNTRREAMDIVEAGGD